MKKKISPRVHNVGDMVGIIYTWRGKKWYHIFEKNVGRIYVSGKQIRVVFKKPVTYSETRGFLD